MRFVLVKQPVRTWSSLALRDPFEQAESLVKSAYLDTVSLRTSVGIARRRHLACQAGMTRSCGASKKSILNPDVVFASVLCRGISDRQSKRALGGKVFVA